jgi:hypothetical protein
LLVHNRKWFNPRLVVQSGNALRFCFGWGCPCCDQIGTTNDQEI